MVATPPIMAFPPTVATPTMLIPLVIPTVPSVAQLGPPADILAGVTVLSVIVFNDKSVPRIVPKKSSPLAGAVENTIFAPDRV